LTLFSFSIALTSLSPTAAMHAEEAGSITEMLRTGNTSLSFRYRFENVDQDGIDKEANASTLKTRLTYTSNIYNGFNVLAEFDNVTVIGSESYRTPTNGKTEYPIVADPDGTDFNQVFIKYSGKHFISTFGRQRINLGSQRFVGGVGWRQNEQTFDALRIQLPSIGKLSLDYSYIDKVNRIFGPDDSDAQPDRWNSDSHALRATYPLTEKHHISGYIYLLDFEESEVNSSTTYGIAYTGELGPLSLNASYATQSDYSDNPISYDADYYNLGVSTDISILKLSAGYEVLGSDDGVTAFRTPLATAHKFQGWADMFLTTPADGIEDAYATVASKIGPVKLALTYHDFKAEEGSDDYGSEVDFVATYPINKQLSAQLKYASYNADSYGVDTDKLWFTVNLAF
jgi:hypothetical protein